MGEDTSSHPVAQMAQLANTIAARLNPLASGRVGHWADTLLCLQAEALKAYSHLWLTPAVDDLQYAAFATRNLLELAVWTGYCTASEENAKRFMQDSARDAAGVAKAFANLPKDFPGMASIDREGSLDQLKSGLETWATSVGLDQLDHNYLTVADAARQLSEQYYPGYRLLSVLLSKLVHPTAISVKTSWPKEFAHQSVATFRHLGTLLFSTVLLVISQSLPTLESRSASANNNPDAEQR